MDYASTIAKELGLGAKQIEAVIALLDEGATIPFIARYRKEAHGSLDEVAIIAIRDLLTKKRELDERRTAILKSLAERELLSDDLAKKIANASTMTELEDIYLPYRPKRRTRAIMAKEKGLEPLALSILDGGAKNLSDLAKTFISDELNVPSMEDALQGARDIIAETVSESIESRSILREHFKQKAEAKSKLVKGKEEEGAKFKDYFDWQEPASKSAGHRVLAMLRGESEGILSLHFLPEAEGAIPLINRIFVKGTDECKNEQLKAIEDGYSRLLAPSLETELRSELKKKAEEEAITVFARNLRQLLLSAPLGQKRVLALDPGYRTGCKTVCLDAQGKLLHHDVVFILTDDQLLKAARTIKNLIKEYAIEAIAIGNGTASRETEALAKSLELKIPIVVVSESGASVYSASEVARKEFPDLDLTVRGAVSIGRRLMDPLAELVKIDPKAIGVGQYQHDVDQNNLKQSLTDVMSSCVNAVGAELNTASPELLSCVSGLGPALSKNIVTYREANGPFAKRKDLLKVPRLGPKAFEQSAGFLRIHKGKEPLDGSAVHPESYGIVEKMAKDMGCDVTALLNSADIRKKIDTQKYVTDKVGLPTLNDIMKELDKPGRDPRETFEVFSFNESVTSMDQLEPGMKLPGIVTNVTNFGAFIDIGVHQDGLVHISQLSDNFVKDPHEVLQVQQKVMATVMEVDIPRKRISLSLKSNPESSPKVHSEDRPKGIANKPASKQVRPNKNIAANQPFNGLNISLKK